MTRPLIAVTVMLALALSLTCGSEDEGKEEDAEQTPTATATKRAEATATPLGVAVTSTAAATPDGSPVMPTVSPIAAEETPTTNDVVSGVLVETDQQEYLQNEVIVVTITNRLDTSITTFNQQAFCSIARLERQDGTEWREVRNCVSGPPSTEVTLEPGTETVVKLSADFLPALSPSIYRASIIFSLGETFDFGKTLVATSQLFNVQ